MFLLAVLYEWYFRAWQNYIHDVNFKRLERSRLEGGGGGRDRAEQSTQHNTGQVQAQGVVQGTTDVWTICLYGRRECGVWRLETDTAGLTACQTRDSDSSPAGWCLAWPVLTYKPNFVKDNKDRCCRLGRGGG